MLVREGSIFQTTSDTEVLLHLYARSKAATPEQALIESVSQAQGAFSLVLLTKDRLIAVRDPHGFRPLTLGRLGDAYIVCSETCALDLIDAEWIRDIEPGEVFIIGPDGAKSHPSVSAGAARRTASSSTCTSRGRIRTSSARASTKCARSSAGSLAREQPADADVVVPVPDSGVCAATGFAEASGVPLQMGLIRNHYVGPHVHRAASGDPALRRAREAQSGEEHSAGPARRARRRLDRARHDEPEDREDGARGRRERSAHAHQLSADDLAVLLRRRHAAAVGAHRGDAFARGDSPVHRRRLARLSQPRRAARRRSGRRATSYCTSCYTGEYPVAFPRRTRRRTCSSRSSWSSNDVAVVVARRRDDRVGVMRRRAGRVGARRRRRRTARSGAGDRSSSGRSISRRARRPRTIVRRAPARAAVPAL